VKITIHKDKLKDAVSTLRSSLATGSVNPILEHFLFEVKNKVLILKSTNLNISIIWETAVESEDIFSFTLPGLTLTSLVSSLEQEDIDINYCPDTQEVTLTCGKYSWEAISGDVGNFPSIVIPDSLTEINLPENFEEMLKTVYFSISSDLTKPDLNSLCIDINRDSSGEISLISTDRIRLSWAKAAVSFEGNMRFVIPKSSAGEILKLKPTKLMYDDQLKTVYFKCEDQSGSYILRTSLTNAKYPDIYAYLTNSFKEKSVTINKSDLIKALKRIKVTSDKIERVGTLVFSQEKATLSSLGPSSKSKEEIKVDLGDMEIPNPFNIKLDLMLDYLSQESNDHVIFKIIDNMCIVFDKENYRHVLSIER